MKKYGFFGGSFNPPTYAHLEIAKKSCELLSLDKVFFVPVGNSYKKPYLIDEKHRYNMLNLMCNNEEKIDVENIELNKEFSISTLEAFRMIDTKYRNIDKYYIMGADNFIKLPNWEDSEYLIKNYKYIVFKRNDINIEKMIEENHLLHQYKFNIKILDLENNKECRSGIIRDLVENGDYDKIKDYTKDSVAEYIRKNTLYKDNYI